MLKPRFFHNVYTYTIHSNQLWHNTKTNWMAMIQFKDKFEGFDAIGYFSRTLSMSRLRSH